MHKVRIIPILLLRDWGLEKSIHFTAPKYVGCPINAARVFNGKNVDELILLDIIATKERRGPQLEVVRQIAEESFMPFTVGGGIRSVDGMWELLKAGADRVVVNTAAVANPKLISDGADRFGRQCIVVSIDAQQKKGGWEVYTDAGTKPTGLDPRDWAVHMEKMGAGEILLTSIDRDGAMDGYDIELVRHVREALTIPLIACGGAGSVKDLADAVYLGGASAVASGAFFLFYGRRRTVLITYPRDEDLLRYFKPEHIRRKDAEYVIETSLARL